MFNSSIPSKKASNHSLKELQRVASSCDLLVNHSQKRQQQFIKVDPKNDKRGFKRSALLLILSNTWSIFFQEILEDEKSAGGVAVFVRKVWFYPGSNRLFS